MDFERLTPKKLILLFLKLFLILLAIVLIATGIGAFSSNFISFWKGVFSNNIEFKSILIGIRFPRVLLALMVGGALSVSGLSLQILLKNPLAEPYTLGISGGATLGATIASLINFNSPIYIISFQTLAALIGSGIILFLLYMFIQKITSYYTISLLMFGIILNAISSAFIMLLYSLFSSTELYSAINWMMGHIPSLSYNEIFILLIIIIPGIILLYKESNSINTLLLGEESAEALGIEIKKIRNKIFIISGVITAVSVSFTGMIGFIGLIIPHICRLIWGSDTRIIMLTSFLLGSIILIIADTLARVIISPRELPVGVITALIGGPYFIYLLKRRLNQ